MLFLRLSAFIVCSLFFLEASASREIGTIEDFFYDTNYATITSVNDQCSCTTRFVEVEEKVGEDEQLITSTVYSPGENSPTSSLVVVKKEKTQKTTKIIEKCELSLSYNRHYQVKKMQVIGTKWFGFFYDWKLLETSYYTSPVIYSHKIVFTSPAKSPQDVLIDLGVNVLVSSLKGEFASSGVTETQKKCSASKDFYTSIMKSQSLAHL